MLMVVPLLTMLLASGRMPAASSDDEIAFGIEVARKGLWNEARFRFERAVEIGRASCRERVYLCV